MSRVDHIARNMRSTIFTQVPLFVLNFIVRRVFIQVLGEQYLGLNGLFSNILSMLSVAELGFGASITFSLYKPVVTGDQEKIKSLMRLYRRVYTAVGVWILAAGTALTPFLDFFVKEMPEGIQHIEAVYLLHLLDSGASYFFSYKTALLFADQKKYVETVIRTCVKLICQVIQLALLVVFHNYLLYAACLAVSSIATNVWISLSADRRYPFLREKNVQPLPEEDKAVIRKNVYAMVFHRFGTVAVFGTDNILMAKFVSLASVGLYSNYLMVSEALTRIINRLYQDIMASIGNLNAVESRERNVLAFNNQNFFSAWFFGWCSICLFHLYNPFITLWLGEAYLFPQATVAVIVLNFYLTCMRKPVVGTKEAMGLFWQDRFAPLMEVALNFVISIALSRSLGILGILLGTSISMLAIPFWLQAVVLYRNGLKSSPVHYFLRTGVYTLITLVAGVVTGLLCALLPGNLMGFLGKMLVCVLVPNGIFFLVYRRTEEFQYLWQVATRLGRKIWQAALRLVQKILRKLPSRRS